jgi:poly(A) polymerase
VFLTGGSLRDRFLGVPTHDLDLVVRGDAEAVGAALAAAFGGTHFALGRPPETTQRVVAGRLQLDVTSAQGELREDILRRDFTANAMLWRLPRGPLTDLTGGADDLAAGRIRVVRAANLRDDPLRVLRGVRLVATRPQLRLTAETETYLSEAAGGLRAVARERILDELRRLLAGSAADRAVLAAARLGLLAPLVPAWKDYQHAPLLARLCTALNDLARSHSRALATAAREIALAAVAAPAAGFPDHWRPEKATTALRRIGLGESAARGAAAAVGVGERLLPALAADVKAARALAVAAGNRLSAALAWALARAATDGNDLRPAARRLLRWLHCFERRPPLLDGAEIAALLALPPDARRAAAIDALRLARARGEVRTRAEAVAFLGSARAR